MAFEPDSRSEVRKVASQAPGEAAAPPSSEPLFDPESSKRARLVPRALVSVLALLLIAAIGYAVLATPADEAAAWTPPPNLTRDETPHWLQTLCADRTPALCAAADRARAATECDAMRAALRALEGVERELVKRGTLSSQQRWVLIELYGQGHELCQFERGGR